MKKVAVILGGGSGIGLATAKNMPKDKIIVIGCRTLSKLEKAVEELQELGYEAYCKVVDVSDREQVKEFAKYCASLGEITNLINSAGVSPMMVKNDSASCLKINALGNVHALQEFEKYMKAGSVVICISSVLAYTLPKPLLNTKNFHIAEEDEELFLKKHMKFAKMTSDEYQAAAITYGISKKFIIWYAQKMALELGKKGIRVASISPGYIATDMGELELSRAGHMVIIDSTIEGRMGTPEEAGYAVATMADERNGYLAGVDILLDGGSIAIAKAAKR